MFSKAMKTFLLIATVILGLAVTFGMSQRAEKIDHQKYSLTLPSGWHQAPQQVDHLPGLYMTSYENPKESFTVILGMWEKEYEMSVEQLVKARIKHFIQMAGSFNVVTAADGMFTESSVEEWHGRPVKMGKTITGNINGMVKTMRAVVVESDTHLCMIEEIFPPQTKQSQQLEEFAKSFQLK